MMPPGTSSRSPRRTDPAWVRIGLTAVALVAMAVLVVIAVISVFAEALADGPGAYWDNLTGDADTRHSVYLTLTVAPLAVLLNLVFGVAAAWAVTRFRFPGRTLLVTRYHIAVGRAFNFAKTGA